MEPEQPFLETPPAASPKVASWQFRGRAARLESVSISLWSWLVLGGFAAWFCLWLAEALSHAITHLPL